MRVLLDANGLMVPVQFSVDIFTAIGRLVGSFEPVTLEGVVRELEGLSNGRGRDAAAAKVGLSLAKRCLVEKSPLSGVPVDDMIVDFADRTGCMVMTNDRRLRERLLDKNIDVISLRNQKTLEIIRG
ncbi:PIN domain-containing protein [Methanolacinia petrolearia]|uniref:type II toxin-antitoxin system VapC family toxin n=1 Tax=Methanolacinia petrolearia TaxID=54120 RepID=UPI003BACBC72